jgi:hypothetical protein
MFAPLPQALETYRGLFVHLGSGVWGAMILISPPTRTEAGDGLFRSPQTGNLPD